MDGAEVHVWARGPERFDEIEDASKLEMVPVVVLVAAILIVGVYPAFITDVFAVGVEQMMEPLRQAALAVAG